ncbi:MAG: CxxC-x17-CxxC domain-containing protein [Deltaproteobacteria bacterium]
MNNQDIVPLLNKIQERLVTLEKKLDALAVQVSPTRLVYSTPAHEHEQNLSHAEQARQQLSRADRNQQQNPPRPQQPQPAHVQNAPRQEHQRRERPMFKAICADCNKECELPFKPSGDRPVYCRECFAVRKANNSLKRAEPKPQETASVQTSQVQTKPEPVEKKKPAARKRPETKKKPANKARKAPGKPAKKKSK